MAARELTLPDFVVHLPEFSSECCSFMQQFGFIMPRRKQRKPGWQSCERGAITKMVADQTDLTRRKVLTSVGAVAGMLTIGGGVTCALLASSCRHDQKNNIQALSCREVLDLLAAYSRNDLDSETMGRVAAHLNLCSYCYGQNHDHRQAQA